MTAKARLTHRDIDVTGIFHFDETGRLLRFETNDRYYSERGGKFVKKNFSAIIDCYKEKNGLQIPQKVRIVWHLEKGDFNYFKGEIEDIIYNLRS